MAVHLAKPESMIAPTVIRVVLVDDHPVMREGLRGVLERSGDIEVAGEGSSGGDAVDLCERLRPDVVLIDLVMPDMDGYSAALLIAAACPGTRVVALSGYSEDEMVLQAVALGMDGYLLKGMTGDALAGAVRAAAAGQPVFSPLAARVLMRHVGQADGLRARIAALTVPPSPRPLPFAQWLASANPLPSPLTQRMAAASPPPTRFSQPVVPPSSPAPPLTEREREVVWLMADGLSDRLIAARLVVSVSTVKFHVRRILTKLGAANRTQAVARALLHRLDSWPDA